MSIRLLAAFGLALVTFAWLAGCGQMGPLSLPQDSAAASPPPGDAGDDADDDEDER